MELALRKGINELFEEVINQNLCTVCGGCAGLCPYLRTYREKVAMIENCGLAEGQCYEVCPRTRTDYEKLCLLYTSPSPRDLSTSRMPSSA